MAIPDKVDYLIIGAGIHGLSTAWHLAEKLKAKGKGDGSKILVVEKDSIAFKVYIMGQKDLGCSLAELHCFMI